DPGVAGLLGRPLADIGHHRHEQPDDEDDPDTTREPTTDAVDGVDLGAGHDAPQTVPDHESDEEPRGTEGEEHDTEGEEDPAGVRPAQPVDDPRHDPSPRVQADREPEPGGGTGDEAELPATGERDDE